MKTKLTFKSLPKTYHVSMVKIELQPARGSNIRVEVWLPEKWNGRLLGLGSGGAAGYINYNGLAQGVGGGYATVSTDMGTAPHENSGVGNAEVWRDFGYRATHLMTVSAKEIVKSHYGAEAELSYFCGASTGGQQALQEAQRYPEDYDGIVANVPAHCRTPLHAYFLWNEQILQRCPFSPEQQRSVIAAANEHMAPREHPLTAGLMVSDPRCTEADVEAVIGRARRGDATLTAAHGEALRRLFGGPRHSVSGERIFNGIPPGCSFNSAHSNLYLFRWVFGLERDLLALDFGADFDAYTAALAPFLNAENHDLSAFRARGGKLLTYSGSADECVPYHATLDYYERVARHCGGMAAAREFCRFYLVPGIDHSLAWGAGVNRLPDALELVVNWREHGVAPETIMGRRVINGETEWKLPVQPYPIGGGHSGVEPVAARFRGEAAF